MAARNRCRRGTAVSELRIVPDEYSLVTVNTAKTTSASTPRRTALKAVAIGSKAMATPGRLRPLHSANATVSTIAVASDHRYERSVRIFVHSNLTASAKPPSPNHAPASRTR